MTVEAGGITQTQEVSGGYGHGAQHDDVVLHFGLGDACTVDRVTVRWPDLAHTTEHFCALPANETAVITQGAGRVEYLDKP